MKALTVKDLIKQLEQFPDEAKVSVCTIVTASNLGIKCIKEETMYADIVCAADYGLHNDSGTCAVVVLETDNIALQC